MRQQQKQKNCSKFYEKKNMYLRSKSFYISSLITFSEEIAMNKSQKVLLSIKTPIKYIYINTCAYFQKITLKTKNYQLLNG